PAPIAPSFCAGVPYWGLYNQTNGVITIPPCGTGMYLFTTTINVTGINGGSVTLNLVINGAVVKTFVITADGTYDLVYRTTMSDGGTASFNVSQTGNVTPAAVNVNSG